jgi:hypothetical protein
MISGVKRFHSSPRIQLRAKKKWVALERSEGEIKNLNGFSNPSIRCWKIKRILKIELGISKISSIPFLTLA